MQDTDPLHSSFSVSIKQEDVAFKVDATCFQQILTNGSQ